MWAGQKSTVCTSSVSSKHGSDAMPTRCSTKCLNQFQHSFGTCKGAYEPILEKCIDRLFKAQSLCHWGGHGCETSPY